MKKLSQLEKMGLVAAVVVACTFFYMKKVYEPQEKVLKKTVEDLNKIVGEINGLKTVPPVAGVKAQIKKHEAELKAVENRLSLTTVRTGSDREVSHFLGQIIAMMEKKELMIRSIVPKNQPGKGGGGTASQDGKKTENGKGEAAENTAELFQWHAYDVELSGGYRSFVRFLLALRNKPDAVKVDRIEISRKEGENLTIKMNLKI